MTDDAATERPRALLLQIAADIRYDRGNDAKWAEQQALCDSFTPEEWAWFRTHNTWDGEIVTAEEFIRRLKQETEESRQRTVMMAETIAPDATPFRLTADPTHRPRQRDLF